MTNSIYLFPYNNNQLQDITQVTAQLTMQKFGSNYTSTVGGGTRSYAVSSRQKFENVDKLQGIVSQIQQTSRGVQPDQVLDILRNKIKNNYNNLYEDYDANKNQILKSIQQTQNLNGQENPIKNKLDNMIKQKSNYDKLKIEVETKQRKLKKMIDLRQQLKIAKLGNQSLRQTLNDRVIIAEYLQKHRQILDYEAAVLKNMEKQRTQIRLNLKQKHDVTRKNEQTKKKRIEKIKDSNHTKQIILKGIEDKIQEEDVCQLPQNLAEELQKKLQHFQGQYAQQNIVIHQQVLNEAKMESQKNTMQKEKEAMRSFRAQKQKQFRKQFKIAQNHLRIKQAQEQKIKKLCCVDNITDLAGDALQQQKNNLQYIRQQLQNQINQIKSETQKVKQDSLHLMTNLQTINKKTSLMTIHKELNEQETQLRRLNIFMEKKANYINDWKYTLQIITDISNLQKCSDDKLAIIHNIRQKAIPIMQNLITKQSICGETIQAGNESKKKQKLKKIIYKSQLSQGSDELFNY